MSKKGGVATLGLVMLMGMGISMATRPGAEATGPEAGGCQTAAQPEPLRKWAENATKHEIWVEAGRLGTSMVYAVGATLVAPSAVTRWRSDSASLPLESREARGTIELGWLGAYGHDPQKRVKWHAGSAAPWEKFSSIVLASAELRLLSECRPGNCKVKLNREELAELATVPPAGRGTWLMRRIEKRVGLFVERGLVQGYEGGEPVALNAIPLVPHLSAFELPRARGEFGVEVLDAQPGAHKPVAAVFNRFCQEGRERVSRCQDLVVYNNHYFDFWARQVQFVPWCGRTLAVFYETADVDQLKGGRVKRFFVKTEIQRTLEAVLEARLRRLRMLGS